MEKDRIRIHFSLTHDLRLFVSQVLSLIRRVLGIV